MGPCLGAGLLQYLCYWTSRTSPEQRRAHSGALIWLCEVCRSSLAPSLFFKEPAKPASSSLNAFLGNGASWWKGLHVGVQLAKKRY